MGGEKERVEPEEHIRALARIWKPKPKAASTLPTSEKEEKPE